MHKQGNEALLLKPLFKGDCHMAAKKKAVKKVAKKKAPAKKKK